LRALHGTQDLTDRYNRPELVFFDFTCYNRTSFFLRFMADSTTLRSDIMINNFTRLLTMKPLLATSLTIFGTSLLILQVATAMNDHLNRHVLDQIQIGASEADLYKLLGRPCDVSTGTLLADLPPEGIPKSLLGKEQLYKVAYVAAWRMDATDFTRGRPFAPQIKELEWVSNSIIIRVQLDKNHFVTEKRFLPVVSTDTSWRSRLLKILSSFLPI
jgi:hypothetical protein